MKKEIRDCMTSELLFQAMKGSIDEKATFLSEYERRLKMMRLTYEQIAKFREADERAITKGCYIKLDTLLGKEPLIKAGMNVNSIQVQNCTFSELVYLTDEANAVYVRDHHWLPAETWGLVCKHALSVGICQAAWENRNRMKEIGLTEEQENIFVRNECQITKRLRWHYSEDMAW